MRASGRVIPSVPLPGGGGGDVAEGTTTQTPAIPRVGHGFGENRSAVVRGGECEVRAIDNLSSSRAAINTFVYLVFADRGRVGAVDESGRRGEWGNSAAPARRGSRNQGAPASGRGVRLRPWCGRAPGCAVPRGASAPARGFR